MSEPAAPAWKHLATIAAFCTAAVAATGCANMTIGSPECAKLAINTTGFGSQNLTRVYDDCVARQAQQQRLQQLRAQQQLSAPR